VRLGWTSDAEDMRTNLLELALASPSPEARLDEHVILPATMVAIYDSSVAPGGLSEEVSEPARRQASQTLWNGRIGAAFADSMRSALQRVVVYG